MPIAQHRMAFPGSTMLDDWKGNPVRFYARVRPGAAPSAVEAELKPVVRDLAASYPEDLWKDEWLSVHPAGRYVSFAEAGVGVALIAALVGLVLVAACMNLGLLVLARTLGREREFAIRLSVGATRGRIVRQLLTEHLLLGTLGAATACFIATRISTAVMSTIGSSGLRPHFNARALLVAAALAVVSSLIFGFAPAWQSMRPAAERRMRLRSVLVGLQVAAASALLIVSGLLVRGVTRIVRVPLGFEYRQTLMADPGLSSYGMAPAAAQDYWRSVEARMREVPGVRNVALTSLPPFGNRVTINRELTIFYHVTPAFFDTMRIPLTRGRVFRDGEADVAIVNETLARRRWPGEDPIGKTYEGRTVIGVSGDARTVRINEGAATECYMPIQPEQLAHAVMVVRVDGAPARAAGTVRAVARGGDERLMPSVVLLEDALEEKLEAPRQLALIASALGCCALLLAVTGLAGMVAFTVSQRLREIGVRVALGARPAHIVRAIARQFTRPIAIGAIAGSALAALAGTVLSREMFGVSRLDPVAHGGALLLFALVAAVAALPSVRRAVRVDPVQMLRHE
jgi:predicted permease